MFSVAFVRRSAAASLLVLLSCTAFTFCQTLKVLHKFHLTDGEFPYSGLVHGSDGYLYGTTFGGGAIGCGTVFKISTSGKFTSIYSFTGGNDGCFPQSSVIRDSSGNVYGTTVEGGATNSGTVFKIDSTGHESVLYAFQGGSDGVDPNTDLVRDKSGNLYGSTHSGGNYTLCIQGCGIVFKIDPTGTETILHTFTGILDGGISSGLVMDSPGNLYGPALIGGLYGYGDIFKIDPSGNFTDLHDFGPGAILNGYYPANDLAFGPKAILYGTTSAGGDLAACSGSGCGVVYSINANFVVTSIHSFQGQPTDGASPGGPVARDSEGNLYGVTYSGGENNGGTVYKLDQSGNETILHSFTEGTDGWSPSGRLYVDSSATIFGTTTSNNFGNKGYGLIFKITQ